MYIQSVAEEPMGHQGHMPPHQILQHAHCAPKLFTLKYAICREQ